jgi:chorismate mutase
MMMMNDQELPIRIRDLEDELAELNRFIAELLEDRAQIIKEIEELEDL